MSKHRTKNGIKKIFPFRIASKIIKCLGITKAVKNLYSENYKALLKEILKLLNKWNNSPCLWKAYYCWDSNTSQIDLQIQLNSYRFPTGLLEEIYKLIPKFIWKFKGPKIAETILEKKNKAGGIILPNSKFMTEPL